ncbi:hypothetical protein [Chitinimonas sp.]
MKQLLSALALLLGTVCVEVTHPLRCNLIPSSRNQTRKKTED